MGMFNDNVSAGRLHWKFRYKGSELVAAAQKLLTQFTEREKEARVTMSGYMLDDKMSNKDPKMSDCRDAIEENGKMKEQCSVFVHEFSRNPDVVYDLGLGDVTFFGLNEKE